MKIIAVVLLLIFASIQAPAQSSERTTTPNPGKKYTFDTTLTFTLHKSLPKMYLRYRDYFDAADQQYYYRVDLSKSKKGKPFQVIKSNSEAYYGPLHYDYCCNDSGMRAMFVDINFDGYVDLRLKKREGGGPYVVNQTYDYYIFDISKFKFQFNEEASDVGNPTPSIHETVFGYWRNGFSGTSGTVSEYKWVGRHLVQVHGYDYDIISRDRDPYADKNTLYKKESYIYKDGKLIRKLHKRIRLKDIPKEHLRYW